MPEIVFTGPSGKLEGRYHLSEDIHAPIVLLLHPNSSLGGHMDSPIVHSIYHSFVNKGLSVLRFNFRGIGKSQGKFDNGRGELADAAAALDWIQTIQQTSKTFWVVGISFGAWIAMQLLMRRPELNNFIAIAPPASRLDFSFLSPCPASGLFIYGEKDKVVPVNEVMPLMQKLKIQKKINIDHQIITNANHFFDEKIEELNHVIRQYTDKLLAE